MTRIGKIARLPHEVREKLNRRLQDGEPAARLVKWLNRRPDVKKLLAREFDGRPINPQNLSDWKAGGYRDWLTHQHALEVSARVAAQAGEFKESLGGKPLTEVLAQWLAGQYLVAAPVLAQQAATDERAWAKLRELCRDLAVLRRGDHQAQRLRLERARVRIACNQECRVHDEEMRAMAEDSPAYHRYLREHQEELEQKEHELSEQKTQILLKLMFGDLADDDWEEKETARLALQRPEAFPKPTPPPPPPPDPEEEEEDEEWEDEEEEEAEAESEQPKAVANAEVKAAAEPIKPDQAKSSHSSAECGVRSAEYGMTSGEREAEGKLCVVPSPSPRPSPPMGARGNAEGQVANHPPSTPPPSAPLECRMASGEGGSAGGSKGERRTASDHQPSTPQPSTPSATPPVEERPCNISEHRSWPRPVWCRTRDQMKEEFVKQQNAKGGNYY